ncbi:MAG: YdiU family protein [Alphaproteobacteria bacterium]|nr:YdiU family protein [Alphaproteobacteria bacterium]
MPFAFDNSYARELDGFYARVPPTPVARPVTVKFNAALAEELGIDVARLEPEMAAAIFSGNRLPAGADPIAMAYAGHQFGHFVPQLGDGRAILLGEVIGRDGIRRDIQLKGSGPTPFSRRGDGRAALGPVLREYLVSEAMHALGIPATRALAAVVTGEQVYRERILPGAVLTRVARSHIRVGTFQFFAVRGEIDKLRQLADHVIARHYPELRSGPSPYLAMLDSIIERQAALVARWMLVGFIHGVMNTDNMAVSGETIDFGPCAFMDEFDPQTVFSSIDEFGRYAYGNQASIAQWNLARLAETLLPLIDADGDKAVAIATARIQGFADIFTGHWQSGMRRKLGLVTDEAEDEVLIQDLLDMMQRSRADFTLTFRRLSDARDLETLRGMFLDLAGFDAWLARWQARGNREALTPQQRSVVMKGANPAFIPRNHRVEQALEAAVNDADLGPFDALLDVLSRPYDDQPDRSDYAEPPEPGRAAYRTFCGT